MSEGIRQRLSRAAEWIGGELIGADSEFHGVSSDSRNIAPGNLFIALHGPNHDGHEHLAAAREHGAVAAIVDHPVALDMAQIVVTDTHAALGQLAAAWRRQLAVTLVGITGSNGKTTTKEMLAGILARAGKVLATRGNLNNDIGLPLTLLRLEPGHRFGVIEMGANHAGEIAYLTGLARPDIALITNAAAAHLEGFGSLDGVAKAKGEIYAGLGEDGTALVNADDQYAPLWRSLAGTHPVVSFGMHSEADVGAAWQDGNLRITHAGEAFAVNLATLGEHNARNALAAATAALVLGIDKQAIIAGLAAVSPVKGRLQLRKGINGARIIDDSYNANPASLQAGIRVLSEFTGERYLAMGDMAELGENAAELHAEAGVQAAKLGIQRLYSTGRLSRNAAEAFGDNGFYFEEQAELIAAMRPAMHAGVTVLVKGSRSSHMERVVEALAAVGEA